MKGTRMENLSINAECVAELKLITTEENNNKENN
jgi:hypothetical protein